MPKKNRRVNVEFQEYLWKALQVFNVYRLLLTTVLIFMQQIGASTGAVGAIHPELYFWTTLLYFTFAILVILLLIKRIPDYKKSVVLQVSLDILAIITLIHAAGGLNNGLGVLLAVSSGTSCLLIGSTRALAVPAIATIGLFAEAIFARFHDLHVYQFTQPALLGTSLFIISILSLTLAKRLYYSEKLAIESQADLAIMEAVSDHIIQTMTLGVIIVDEKNNVRLINATARKNIGIAASSELTTLIDFSVDIYSHLSDWRENSLSSTQNNRILLSADDKAELHLKFRQLGDEDHNLILIFLEDTSIVIKKAQQLKLSSLGRLTASIAHEIRNPLGAISHAAQLLEESENILEEDKKLCDIIAKHSKKMNGIIENVMSLSQRRVPKQELIILEDFLKYYIEELSVQQGRKNDITLSINPPESHITFDYSQLLQLIDNLCDNGLRYSEQYTGTAKLLLNGGLDVISGTQFLDIIDYGPGVSEVGHLFEPFYTTSENGTGLGLYLAREICEANGARLSYRPSDQGSGSCFRIDFPNPLNRING